MNIPALFHLFKYLRPAFSRQTTCLYFFLLVIALSGFKIQSITDVLRALNLEPCKYTRFVNFLESPGIKLKSLKKLWMKWVSITIKGFALKIAGKSVLVLDATHLQKKGRKLPKTYKIYDSSTKVHSRGYKVELIGLIVKKVWVNICIPIDFLIHEKKSDKEKQTSKITKWIHDMIETSSSLLVADSWYACQEIYFASLDLGMSFVSRVKSNAVGYEDPLPEEQPIGRGAKRKYGKKVKIREEFSKPGFISAEIEGQNLEYKRLCLLWKPVMEKVVFILVRTQCGKQFILFSNDHSLKSEEIITAYKARVGIERSFRSLKQDFALGNCKKWSKNKLNEEIKLRSHEVFMMANIIAMGFTQLLSVGYSETVWSGSQLWLRTVNKALPPSEAVVKSFIKNQILRIIPKQQNSFAFWKKEFADGLEQQSMSDNYGNNNVKLASGS